MTGTTIATIEIIWTIHFRILSEAPRLQKSFDNLDYLRHFCYCDSRRHSREKIIQFDRPFVTVIIVDANGPSELWGTGALQHSFQTTDVSNFTPL